ncbi:hypothetical protein [Halomonas sp. ALS9]|uniref:hypothetical protein n=1 Tax=Halomonas sp. ALS9 TaxID=1805819 RepID=UPI0007D96874|nr:hypothetical protein [Halomonas sp. ALS9]OAL61081.1 hypothetical protein A6R74_15885 [Halomonas sp. ALS9]
MNRTVINDDLKREIKIPYVFGGTCVIPVYEDGLPKIFIDKGKLYARRRNDVCRLGDYPSIVETYITNVSCLKMCQLVELDDSLNANVERFLSSR